MQAVKALAFAARRVRMLRTFCLSVYGRLGPPYSAWCGHLGREVGCHMSCRSAFLESSLLCLLSDRDWQVLCDPAVIAGGVGDLAVDRDLVQDVRELGAQFAGSQLLVGSYHQCASRYPALLMSRGCISMDRGRKEGSG